MILVCTATYALGKELGLVDGTAEFERQMGAPDLDSLPCVRVATRLRTYDDMACHHDIAATSIAKSRSRAFHAARKLDPDVVFWVDDDVEADSHTLGMMIDAVRGQNVICFAPCWTRGGRFKVNVELEPDPAWRELPTQGRTLRCVAGGFGLVAMSREAMTAIAEHNQGSDFDEVSGRYNSLSFEDEDGETKLALFSEFIEKSKWLGEDIAFCRRALVAGVALEALATGITVHDGNDLDLTSVAALLSPPVPPAG